MVVLFTKLISLPNKIDVALWNNERTLLNCVGFDFKYVPSLGTREEAIVRILPPALPFKSQILTIDLTFS